MKRIKIYSFLTAASAVIAWAGALAFYYAYTKQYTTVFYFSAILFFVGILGVVTSFLLASFAGSRKYKQIWLRLYFEYLLFYQDKEENGQGETDYKACIEKMRQKYGSDTDKYKNRVEKAHSAGEKKLLDYSVLENGKIYYASMVMANSNLFKSTRFINKTYPAVFVYSTDGYFAENPKELIDIAEKAAESNLDGLLKNQSRYFLNYKVCSEITGNREVYFTVCMVCRRQLPFGKLGGRIVPLIANPPANSSAFVLDSKYWTGEILDLHYNGHEQDDSYGQPFDI